MFLDKFLFELSCKTHTHTHKHTHTLTHTDVHKDFNEYYKRVVVVYLKACPRINTVFVCFYDLPNCIKQEKVQQVSKATRRLGPVRRNL